MALIRTRTQDLTEVLILIDHFTKILGPSLRLAHSEGQDGGRPLVNCIPNQLAPYLDTPIPERAAPVPRTKGARKSVSFDGEENVISEKSQATGAD